MLQKRKYNDEALSGMLIFGLALFMFAIGQHNSGTSSPVDDAAVISGAATGKADRAVLQSLPEVPDFNSEHLITARPFLAVPLTATLYVRVLNRSLDVDLKRLGDERQGQNLFIDRILVALHPASLPAKGSGTVSS